MTYQPNPNYCNDPPGTTPDSFTYTLTGGSTATVLSPSRASTTRRSRSTTLRPSAGGLDTAATIDALSNDADVDGGQGDRPPSSATHPDNGTVVLTGGTPGAHTGVNYGGPISTTATTPTPHPRTSSCTRSAAATS